MIYKTFDVLIVPYPFIDSYEKKIRPIVVISSTEFNKSGFLIAAMITSSTSTHWHLDTPINNLNNAGLTKPCFVRMKLATLDIRIIHKKIGALSNADQKLLKESMRNLFLLT